MATVMSVSKVHNETEWEHGCWLLIEYQDEVLHVACYRMRRNSFRLK
jgi:hypothetical protein